MTDVETGSAGQYSLPLGYLRAFVIVLVVLHHAACAYLPIVLPASPASSFVEHMHTLRAISPVNDPQRSFFFLFIASFNDKFFMSLMFFISGLFVWRSIEGKGKYIFLRDRLLRLGLPFAAMVALGPLTYYTTYLQTGGSGGFSGFWHQWTSLDDWPEGPAWFISVLFFFDVIAVLCSALMPAAIRSLRKASAAVFRRPALFFVFLFSISAVAYLPMISFYDPNTAWWTWGPLKFQTSRIFLYLSYFLTGLVIGAYGIERTFLTPNSVLARRWVFWAVLALLAFLASLAVGRPGMNRIVIGLVYILSCCASCLAFLSIFLRFARRRRSLFDSFSANSYGVFVIHYAVVAWLLYAMLHTVLPALAKGGIVFLCALLLSWAAIAAIRRIPGVARVL